MSKLTVKAPAIKTKEGDVVAAPNKSWSHDDIIVKKGVNGTHGFVLSDGSWAGRKKAADIAKSAGEVSHPGKKLHSSELRKGKNNK